MLDAITTFFNAWSVEDAGARAAAIAPILSDDVTYADPMTDAPLQGQADVAEYIGNFVKMAPGSHVAVIDPVDDKNGYVRATIRFVMGDKAQTGQYFITHADGKLTQIVGFAGKGAE